MTLQLAYRSISHPRGIIEDELVMDDKFIFHMDFVGLDVDEDVEVPLILGRPFLATSLALIDICNGKMTLRVDEDVVLHCRMQWSIILILMILVLIWMRLIELLTIVYRSNYADHISIRTFTSRLGHNHRPVSVIGSLTPETCPAKSRHKALQEMLQPINLGSRNFMVSN